MNNKQKQHLLAFLGYYEGQIDGILGKASQAATRAFQSDCGLEADGIFGPDTEKRIRQVIGNDEQPQNWWDPIKHFTREEFACKCGGKYCDGYPVEPVRKLVEAADKVREHFGVPVILSSGVRCRKHNANVGGVAGSRHLYGKAMDFCVRGQSASMVLAYVQSLPQIRYAYAIDSSYVHMDVE